MLTGSRYNITGVSRDGDDDDEPQEFVKKRKGGHRHGKPKDDCSLPENEDKPHCVFKTLPRYYSKDSPSRRNGPLSPLGYTQFYLPTLDVEPNQQPQWEVEYSTLKPKDLVPGNETQPLPIPLHLLPGFDEAVFSEDADDEVAREKRRNFENEMKRITPWRMKDLTIGSYVNLARRLVAEKKMWNKFSDYM